LIFIILSAKTAEASYLRTYDALKNAFDDWFHILDTPRGSVAHIISSGGLSDKKEAQIRALLDDIKERTGAEGLNLLSKMSTNEAEEFLTSLPGVGLKTARCVLMYSLGREVFPVDTHVRRVLSRLGIIRFERLSDKVQNSIQKRVPSEIRYKLHVNLVAHGRAICRARNPLCNSCVLSDICKYYAD
jgi:endonuclease III